MPKVVSNTTPIIALLTIQQLGLLRDLYGEIFIPHGVFEEVENGKNKEFYTDLSAIDWIKIEKINDSTSLSYFLDLDKGEAEAIVLAKETGVDLLILDEVLGRFHARHAGIKITGTLGVLLKAKEKGFVNELKPLLKNMVSKNIWLSDKVIRNVLMLANETP